MTNNIKINIETHATIAIIASVCGLHKFNNATQKHITLVPSGSIMPYNDQ